MSSEPYNGYTNWETWNTALWIYNNENLNDTVVEQAVQIALDAKNDRDMTTYDMRIAIERMLKETLLAEDTTEGWIADMFHSAVERVDFTQIAELLIDECIRRVEL
jgi:hypothetical protein